MSKGDINPQFTQQEKMPTCGPGWATKGGGEFRGANETETTLPPRPGQGGGLSGPHLLNNPWCPGRSRRNWDVTSGELAKLHLTLLSAAWRPVPPPSPKRVSGSLPGWAFSPFNREIGNGPQEKLSMIAALNGSKNTSPGLAGSSLLGATRSGAPGRRGQPPGGQADALS